MPGAQEQRRRPMKPATIHDCALYNDLLGLRSKLEENPSLLNARSGYMMQTPLHVAAGHNNYGIVKFLLEWKGAEKIELEATNTFDETPLHMAAKNGCNESAKILIEHGAFLEAKAKNGMTPLHLAAWYAHQTDSCDTVSTLLEHNANCSATDDDQLTPLDHIKKGHRNDKLLALIQYHIDKQKKRKAMETCSKVKEKMDEFEAAISDIVGLQELKMQLRRWARGMLFDEKRRTLGLSISARRPPHMAFMGNPGTGKTMVARALGKLLHMVGILPSDKVTEVQRTDLVGEFVGHTGPKTRKKIMEADGGILFVDEAYRLIPMQKSDDKDYGLEALEEIMSVMDSGRIVVIFAGYREPMKRVIESNEGFCRRVTKFFYFDDFTTTELAQILHIKMTDVDEKSTLYGFKLHPSCTLEAVAELINRETTEELRKQMNGGLIEPLLMNARENLDLRLDFDCTDADELITITMEDLKTGLRLLLQ
ncbi:LOW QUALITY PROTEIN: ribulose bisphosphate carboxylase/oxygenase activase, chloroplastic [Dioscorea cayenensis subsp. rotundata]|uniref:LOW QUALITY PROTEIN: ribulose bisphosphate carboxylase/oxygenase activase, chloroplastic n=1 Tax=Dioscorea cayennensis subsp. rotundata TaxID=55577 RepID=A0AB40BDE8_DIOCR|nr:LOW QUALITY PROTEIN: ribulose bisphosphate carboxylase/oxygenase activase, chloroplastic [Dioscorea cayenensis subsp. rotundata]